MSPLGDYPEKQNEKPYTAPNEDVSAAEVWLGAVCAALKASRNSKTSVDIADDIVKAFKERF